MCQFECNNEVEKRHQCEKSVTDDDDDDDDDDDHLLEKSMVGLRWTYDYFKIVSEKVTESY